MKKICLLIGFIIMFICLFMIVNNQIGVNYHFTRQYLKYDEFSSLDDVDLNEEFESYEVVEEDDNFVINGEKNYSFEENDLCISDDDLKLFSLPLGTDDLSLKYEIGYYADEGIYAMSCYIDNSTLDCNIIEAVPGILTKKNKDFDVRILVKKYYFNEDKSDSDWEGKQIDEDYDMYTVFTDSYWLSDLHEYYLLEQNGFFSNMFDLVGQVARSLCGSVINKYNNITKKVDEISEDCIKMVADIIKPVITCAIKTAKIAVQKTIGIDEAAEYGAYILNMEKDDGGIYHAGFDCWQQYFGYNDFYDFCFHVGTAMDRRKFKFYDEDGDGFSDYIIWLWKGDYVNLGAGLEIGFYKRFKYAPMFWYVSKKVTLKMTIKLIISDTIIIDWNANDVSQWWITGFNPKYQDYLASEMTGYYEIEFSSDTLDDELLTNLESEFYNEYVTTDDENKNKSNDKWKTVDNNGRYWFKF